MTRPTKTTATVPPHASGTDLWGFFAFSHGWTWLCWGVVAVWGVELWTSPPAMAVFAIGGLGLPVGGAYMTWRTAGREGLRDLGRRLVEPGRLSPWWWAVVLGLQPAIKLAAGGLALLLGATDAPFDLEQATALALQPVDLLLYLGFVFLLGPLPEEIGWRGYLLDRLQVRVTALGASILVGIAWFAYHWPLFFIAGYYARAGGAPDLLQFGIAIVLGAILYTWIYNHTDRSVLAVIVFHFSGNVTGELLDAGSAVYAYETYLTVLLVLVLLWWEGGATLHRRSADRSRGG